MGVRHDVRPGAEPVQNGETHVFGPLPPLHRTLLVVAALVVGVASGAWLAHLTAMPVAISAGAALGAVGGSLLAFALVHDFHPRPRPARVVRRH
jgi:hypothetical protein